MEQSLIVICDEKSLVFGEDIYQSSAYGICDLAEAMETDQFEVREALLAIGGEADGPHLISEGDIRRAIKEVPFYGRYYDGDEEMSIEKAVKEASRGRRDVFCSFSLC